MKQVEIKLTFTYNDNALKLFKEIVERQGLESMDKTLIDGATAMIEERFEDYMCVDGETFEVSVGVKDL